MKKNYLLHLPLFLGALLFISLSARAFDVKHCRLVLSENQEECDSVFFSHLQFAVKNVTATKKEVLFIPCDSTGNSKVRKVPWSQIKYIKKADGTIIDAKNYDQLPLPDDYWDKKVNNLKLLAIWSIPAQWLLGIGIFMSIAVWVQAARYRKKIHGHPREKELLKKIKKAKRISLISWFIFVLGIILLVLLIGYLLKHLFDDVEFFHYDPQ